MSPALESITQLPSAAQALQVEWLLFMEEELLTINLSTTVGVSEDIEEENGIGWKHLKKVALQPVINIPPFSSGLWC